MRWRGRATPREGAVFQDKKVLPSTVWVQTTAKSSCSPLLFLPSSPPSVTLSRDFLDLSHSQVFDPQVMNY